VIYRYLTCLRDDIKEILRFSPPPESLIELQGVCVHRIKVREVRSQSTVCGISTSIMSKL